MFFYPYYGFTVANSTVKFYVIWKAAWHPIICRVDLQHGGFLVIWLAPSVAKVPANILLLHNRLLKYKGL